jgi:negative regulator of sigma E activity
MLDCSKIDELMMDWLYQELDESSSARVAEHVHGCARCSAEASALQRTRAAFRDLSPVDPPMAVSAILMHEAARRAPAVAVAAPRAGGAEDGFWARVRSWFRPIMLHPAAAAVAMLVLVAGVAGTLYVRHGDEMADTQDLKLPVTASDSTGARAAQTGAAER